MKCRHCQTDIDNRGDCPWGCSQEPEAKEPPRSGSLHRLVQRLGDLDRMESAWRKERDGLLIEVGQAMRDHRESAKVSLRELSRRLGCSAPFLSDMELGRRKYSIEWCRKAFSALNSKTEQPAKR